MRGGAVAEIIRPDKATEGGAPIGAQAAVAPAAVEIARVGKRFGTVAALNDVSLAVRRGEFLSLLGPSGCGKTTLLRIIAGLERPTQGAIHILGQRVDSLPPYLRNIGMVFQQYALFPHKSVEKNIEFGLRFRTRMRRGERLAEIKRALALVRLSGYEERRPSQLSGGEQQRVALARAVVTQPDVLLLDEPLSNLDAKLRDEMRVEIKALHRALGITFVYVTHDRHEALAMSDRVAVMRAGEIEQIGSPREVYECPASLNVARFMGHGNILPAIVVEAGASRLLLRVIDGPVVAARGPAALQPGMAVELVVRGDSLSVDPGRGRGDGAEITAEATSVLYNGSFLDVDLRLKDGTPLRAALPNDGGGEIAVGDSVRLAIKAHGTWVLPRHGDGRVAG
jgi:ABC-type Fe3+/spermidine/putrescine transport system ATPase subunit